MSSLRWSFMFICQRSLKLFDTRQSSPTVSLLAPTHCRPAVVHKMCLSRANASSRSCKYRRWPKALSTKPTKFLCCPPNENESCRHQWKVILTNVRLCSTVNLLCCLSTYCHFYCRTGTTTSFTLTKQPALLPHLAPTCSLSPFSDSSTHFSVLCFSG